MKQVHSIVKWLVCLWSQRHKWLPTTIYIMIDVVDIMRLHRRRVWIEQHVFHATKTVASDRQHWTVEHYSQLPFVPHNYSQLSSGSPSNRTTSYTFHLSLWPHDFKTAPYRQHVYMKSKFCKTCQHKQHNRVHDHIRQSRTGLSNCMSTYASQE